MANMDNPDESDQDQHDQALSEQHRKLPDDLPTSLDDRRSTRHKEEVEVYDAWQGMESMSFPSFLSSDDILTRHLAQPQLYSASALTKPLEFNLSLDEPDAASAVANEADRYTNGRLDQMLAAKAAHKEDGSKDENEDRIASDEKMPEPDKRDVLQRSLNLSASNGDMDRLHRLLSGPARRYVDLNAPDTDGTPPLIYASCFGHEDVVESLLKARADVDRKDFHKWTALMWATANRHRNIVKLLLEHGASPDAKSSSGRTAFEFVDAKSDISEYLHEKGYRIGSAGMNDDFYDSGVTQERFEEEMAENEMKRRMAMESAMNLEVDLGNLGLDEQPDVCASSFDTLIDPRLTFSTES